MAQSGHQQKARGAFFTPRKLTGFLSRWGIRSAEDRVLEPSCGDAEFLISSLKRLQDLGAGALAGDQLHGVELHPPSWENAVARLRSMGVDARITNANFFDYSSNLKFEAVLGNPPYVRYQAFSGTDRQKALEAALVQGVRLSGLSSSWAAFTVHAASFLKPGGRLGLVLPAELLSVKYAAEIRDFLLRRFRSISLVMFQELVFPEVQEEVLLLLAEGEGPSQHFKLFQAANLDALAELDRVPWRRFSPGTRGKWTPALLSPKQDEAYQRVLEDESFENLLDWGQTYLGVVTGNNKFFALNRERLRDANISRRDVIAVSPPGSRHLGGLAFSKTEWSDLDEQGKAVFLFCPHDRTLSESSAAYVSAGEKTGVCEGYKCRNRAPWWQVPLVPVPDLFLTYMDRDRPRLVTNKAAALHLNSLYGVRLKRGRKRMGIRWLPLAALNTVSLLGAEIIGRSYGGGILKMEPREADKLPVPSLRLTKELEPRLKMIRQEAARALSSGDVERAVQVVDQEVLVKGIGVSPSILEELRDARSVLLNRRLARSAGRSA